MKHCKCRPGTQNVGIKISDYPLSYIKVLNTDDITYEYDDETKEYTIYYDRFYTVLEKIAFDKFFITTTDDNASNDKVNVGNRILESSIECNTRDELIKKFPSVNAEYLVTPLWAIHAMPKTACTRLAKVGICNLEDLLRIDDSFGLLHVRGIGEKTFNDIDNAIYIYCGIRLKRQYS